MRPRTPPLPSFLSLSRSSLSRALSSSSFEGTERIWANARGREKLGELTRRDGEKPGEREWERRYKRSRVCEREGIDDGFGGKGSRIWEDEEDRQRVSEGERERSTRRLHGNEARRECDGNHGSRGFLSRTDLSVPLSGPSSSSFASLICTSSFRPRTEPRAHRRIRKERRWSSGRGICALEKAPGFFVLLFSLSFLLYDDNRDSNSTVLSCRLNRDIDAMDKYAK